MLYPRTLIIPGFSSKSTYSETPLQTHFNARKIEFFLFFTIFSATVYQAILCIIHTHLFATPTLIVGFTEFSIYAICFAILAWRIRLEFVALIAFLLFYLGLLAVLKSYFDFKSFRDLLIPILFYWLGRTYGSINFANRLLKYLVITVLSVGFFEIFAPEFHSRIFNIFSYYISQGGLTGEHWSKGSTLALNAIRPGGIGRTILPNVLGSSRISSVFLEPVSFGNFSVIIAAWALSKERIGKRNCVFIIFSVAVMVTMADSRYALVAIGLLISMRIFLSQQAHKLAILMPIICVGLLIFIATIYEGTYSDNIIGRLYISGTALSRFDIKEIFGLSGYTTRYGDMGYALVLTRFGIVLSCILWLSFWLVKMQDLCGVRFRAYVSVYISMIMMVGGDPVFALKTAGVLWFLVGCCAARLRKNHELFGEVVPLPIEKFGLPKNVA